MNGRMKYGRVEGVSKGVSRLVLGTSGPHFDEAHSMDLLDGVWALGVNTFDTARRYGDAESLLGKWLARRGVQKEAVILSKGGHPSLFGRRLDEKSLRKDLKRSLEALGLEKIDIYLLHRDDARRPVGEIVETLNALHAEGRIGAFGGSNWTAERIAEANEYAYRRGLVPFTASSPCYSLAVMECDPWRNGAVTISGKQNAESRAWYRQSGCAVFAYAALGHGLFSAGIRSSHDLKGWGKRAFSGEENASRLERCRLLAQKKGATPCQVALAYLYSSGMNVYAVVASASHAAENAAACSLELTPEERAYLSGEDLSE